MRRRMLGGKIHRATVTGACLDYEGSVTIDSALLEAGGILENEAVEVWNVTTGARLTTYALAGEPGSGELCLNGSAAHHASVGDLVILATFVDVDADEAASWRPRVVFVDEANRIRSRRAERADCALEARGLQADRADSRTLVGGRAALVRSSSAWTLGALDDRSKLRGGLVAEPAESDLPPRLGAPARRALAAKGIVRMGQLTGIRESELRRLHGMGPKAIEQLREALGERGMSFRSEADA